MALNPDWQPGKRADLRPMCRDQLQYLTPQRRASRASRRRRKRQKALEQGPVFLYFYTIRIVPSCYKEQTVWKNL